MDTKLIFVIWACCWPIAWSIIEYIDAKRLLAIGKTPEEENKGFDTGMLFIYVLGFIVING